MAPRIAIPEPTSDDPEYNARALPQYLEAIKAAGAEPVVISLSDPQASVAKLLASVQGVLLPGSGHDVDPALYGETPAPETATNDAARAVADELLLQDAFNLRKPILAICHGTQTLNVWRGGSLIQDLKTPVNHKPGRDVVEAHPVRIEPGSRLTEILGARWRIRCASEFESPSGNSQRRRQSARDCNLVQSTASSKPLSSIGQIILSLACSGIPSAQPRKASFRARSSLHSFRPPTSGTDPRAVGAQEVSPAL